MSEEAGNADEDVGGCCNHLTFCCHKKAEEFIPESFKERKRHHTDCICFILLLAAWFAMTIVGLIALGGIKDDRLPAGNPMRLIYAIDYDGRTCGYSTAVKDKPNAYYMLSGAAVCVKDCPGSTDLNSFHCFDEFVDKTTAEKWFHVARGECMYYTASDEVAYRCVPEGATNMTDSLLSGSGNSSLLSDFNIPTEYTIDDAGDAFNKVMADIYAAKEYIFAFGLGVGFVISLAYLYFLRIPGLMFLIIWGAVLSFLIVLIAGAILICPYLIDFEAQGKTASEILMIEIGFYVVATIAFLYLCLVLVLRSRIQLAIHIIQEAARALATMPNLILLPVVQSVGIAIFLVPWVIYSIFLASSGEIVTQNTGTVSFNTYEYGKNTKYAFLYMIFMWFWTSQFIIAIGQLIIALSITCWYFTRDKGDIGTGTPIWAARNATWYHVGTAAFGSLIIAIVSTIQVIITYLERKAERSGNVLAKAVLRCINCCVYCLGKFIKFLSKNVYILVAIHGHGFCSAAMAAVVILTRNVLRVSAVNMVAGFVLMLGKIMVPCVTTLLCFLFVRDMNTNGIILPMLLVFILSYFVSCMFQEIFGMSIETILLCFIADEQMYPIEKRFADGSLQDAITKTAQQASASAKVHVEDSGSSAKEVQVEQPAACSGGELL